MIPIGGVRDLSDAELDRLENELQGYIDLNTAFIETIKGERKIRRWQREGRYPADMPLVEPAPAKRH